MIKIFLVEDEKLALRVLECKINDLEGPYEIVGTASNGIQALEKIPVVNPAIVITDIRMPDMDGISLTQQLHIKNPDILCVILSGYQEFEYAKQAMRLGVRDYLLKPVALHELKLCLEHCMEQLEERSRGKNAISLLVGENTLTFTPLNGEEDFAAAYMIAGSIINTPNHIIHPCVSYAPCEKLEALISSSFPATISVHCFDGFFTNEKIFIFSGNHLDASKLNLLLSAAVHKLENFFKSFVTVYFSCQQHTASLGNAILSCRTQAEQCMILWKSRVCSSKSPLPEAWPGLAKQAELFLLLLGQNQHSLLRSNILRLFRQWQEAERTALAIHNDLMFLLEYFRYSTASQMPPNSSFLVENLISFSERPEELAENFYELLTHLISPAKVSGTFLTAEELVTKMDDYFREHLSRNLSLQTLSEEFGVSKVYLCRIFKKYKETTPIDYFNRLKIEKAKELLLGFPQMPLREISDFLGFSDMYYFSKVFKRITGKSPSEIRDGG